MCNLSCLESSYSCFHYATSPLHFLVTMLRKTKKLGRMVSNLSTLEAEAIGFDVLRPA